MNALTVFGLVVAIVAAFVIMIPSMTWIRRICGYMVAADIVCSMYVVTTFASTGAVQGLTIAIYAALGLSLSLRALKAVLGYEVLEAREVMEHETGFQYSAWQQSLRLVAAELLTQAAAWIYSFLKGAITRTRVTPPEELGVRWRRHPGWLTEWIKHFFKRS